MVDAIRKPNPLEIGNEMSPVFIIFFAFIMLIDGFQAVANNKIVFVVLIIDQIAPGEGSLIQVPGEDFLVEAEFFKAIDLIAQYANIGKLFSLPLEVCYSFV